MSCERKPEEDEKCQNLNDTMNLSEHPSHNNPSGADLFLLHDVFAATGAGKRLSLTRLAVFLGFSPPESVSPPTSCHEHLILSNGVDGFLTWLQMAMSQEF